MQENTPKPKNIFEAASSIAKARTQKKAVEKEEITPELIRAREEGEQITVVSEIFHKGKKLHEEIASQIDSVFTKNKIAPSTYRNYLSRPQNFSAREWEQLDEQKKKNEVLLRDLSKKVKVKVTSPQSSAVAPEPSPTPEPKKEEAPEKKPPPKKAKIITRRQWIGM